MFYWICYFLFWPFIKLFFWTKTVGGKNIPKKGPVICTCNHFSNNDVFIVSTSVRRRLFFLSKKELMNKKIIGPILRSWGAFPVDRGNADLAAVKFVLTKLKQGRAMGFFPEGTRNKLSETELQELKSGVIVFAAKSGAPVVPMMFAKKPRIFRRNWLIVGEPINFEFGIQTKPTKDEIINSTELLSKTMQKLQSDFWANRKNKK